MTRSGCPGTKLPTCDYFIELSFLRDTMTSRKTESNIPTEATTSKSKQSLTLTAPIVASDNTRSNPVNYDAKTIRSNRKRRSDQIDELLAISLSNDLIKEKERENDKSEEHKPVQSQDEDVLFCSSLVTTFQKLKGKKNKMAKMKVMQVLLDFEEDDDNIQTN